MFHVNDEMLSRDASVRMWRSQRGNDGLLEPFTSFSQPLLIWGGEVSLWGVHTENWEPAPSLSWSILPGFSPAKPSSVHKAFDGGDPSAHKLRADEGKIPTQLVLPHQAKSRSPRGRTGFTAGQPTCPSPLISTPPRRSQVKRLLPATWGLLFPLHKDLQLF